MRGVHKGSKLDNSCRQHLQGPLEVPGSDGALLLCLFRHPLGPHVLESWFTIKFAFLVVSPLRGYRGWIV